MLGTNSNYGVQSMAISAESEKFTCSTAFSVLFERLEFFSLNIRLFKLRSSKKVRLNKFLVCLIAYT